MKTFVSAFALALGLVFTGPAFAQDDVTKATTKLAAKRLAVCGTTRPRSVLRRCKPAYCSYRWQGRSLRRAFFFGIVGHWGRNYCTTQFSQSRISVCQ